jgi:predicted TIM-barrel fold metal-dependent hydrolase
MHTHVFTIKNVPDRFLPLGLVKVFQNKQGAKILSWVLMNLNPLSKSGYFNRINAFGNASRHETQADILEDMMGFYTDKSRFAVLAMDFEQMGAGNIKEGFLHQIKDLSELKKKYAERLYPFIAADPRRPGIFKLVREYIEVHQFAGIKIYPSLGFFPFDDRLEDIYKYAEDNQIPITVHCSPDVMVCWRGRLMERWFIHPKTGEKLQPAPNRKFMSYMTHPANYYWVFDKHPHLKLNFGHFGGAQEWDKYLDETWPPQKRLPQKPGDERLVCNKESSWLSTITSMMTKYPNVYADISYTGYKDKYLPLIKVLTNNEKLRGKILYGSDCYMVQLDESEKSYSLRVRGYLGEDDFRQIAETNPIRFLARKKQA